jgi:hypothetical protein
MSEESMRILNMLGEGKITAAEAEQLLKALGENPAEPAAKTPPRFLRVTVSNPSNGEQVNVRVPLAILRSGIRLGSIMPGVMGGNVATALKEKGIDLDSLKQSGPQIEELIKSLGELNIEVDGADKARVRVFCE